MKRKTSAAGTSSRVSAKKAKVMPMLSSKSLRFKGDLSFCLQVGRLDQESVPKRRDPLQRVVTKYQVKVLPVGLFPV